MAPTDGLDVLELRRAQVTGKRRLPPARHPKAEQASGVATPLSETASEEPVALPPVAERQTPLEAVLEAPQQGSAEQHATAPPEQVPRRRSRVRATQVHLDEIADDHLSELRKRAVLADVDLTASAVLRLALSELVAHHGYDRIVAIFAEDAGRLRRGRPRP